MFHISSRSDKARMQYTILHCTIVIPCIIMLSYDLYSSPLFFPFNSLSLFMYLFMSLLYFYFPHQYLEIRRHPQDNDVELSFDQVYGYVFSFSYVLTQLALLLSCPTISNFSKNYISLPTHINSDRITILSCM